MRRLLASSLVAAAVLFAVGATSVHAGGQGRFPIAGIVPHVGATSIPHAIGASGSGPLVYHGGWTMRTNTTYAIYWVPSGSSMSTGYEGLIDGYFADVAAASGSTTNVYSTDTQYYDTTGPIAYASTFGGSYVDTTPFPTNGCNDNTDPVCLTDAQLRTEIENAIQAENWPEGQTSLFFIMTPDNVGICTDGSGRFCTTNTFCAYHSGFNGTSGPVVYAVEPYDATIGGGQGCFAPLNGQGKPHNSPADVTINTISHEHNEAITDPAGTGWWANDTAGDEIADLCAWNFGPALGGTSGYSYNQVINGNDYSLQEEYSNDGSSCVQRYTPPIPPPTVLSLPVVSGAAAVGQVLTTTAGTWTGSPTGYTYRWQDCAADGTGCTDIPAATGSSYQAGAGDAGHTVRAEVVASNPGGSSAPSVSAPTAVVVPVPASTAPPAVSGRIVVGKTLTATNGTWNTTPSSYAYAWLRCAKNGSRCTAIGGAATPTYVLVPADTGHTIEAQVSATNAAGTTPALSPHTTVVIGVPALKKKPRVAGRPKVKKRLTARKGIWSGPPSGYRYQWLRCNPHGRSCRQIKGARYVRYHVRKGDAGHRLRVRVIALNAAGKATAISGSTRVVQG